MADGLTYTTVYAASDHRGPGISITKIERRASGFLALAYKCSLEEDVDGAPECYGLNNPRPVNAAANPDTALQHDIKMLETSVCNAADPYRNCEFAIQNANVPAAQRPVFQWVGVYAEQPRVAHAGGRSVDQRGFLEARGFRDAQGNLHSIPSGQEGKFPVIQPDRGRGGQSNSIIGAPGFYVSTTSTMINPDLDAWDQLRYLDATDMPYAAWAGWMDQFQLRLGDFGLAMRYGSEATTGYVYGDAGTSRVGEVSRELFETLAPGRDNEPRDFIFLAFPNSGVFKVSPDTDAAIQQRVRTNVMRLNAVPDNSDIAIFLNFGADLDMFRRFQANRLSDAQAILADARYQHTEWMLRSYGFIPGGINRVVRSTPSPSRTRSGGHRRP